MSESKPAEKKPRKSRAKAKPVVEAVVPTPAVVPPVVEVVAPPVVQTVVVPNPNAIGNLMDAPAQPHIHVAAYSPNNPRFIVRCQKCRWAEVNNGTSAALKHLHEIPNNCPTCGKARQFRCPKCGRPSKMTRVKEA